MHLPELGLTELDQVALDRIFDFLPDQDLRAFHQVSRDWKEALESRKLVNDRRQQLVMRIRNNKENLVSRLKEDLPENATQVSRSHSVGRKNVLLEECSNLMISVHDHDADSPMPNLSPNRGAGNLTSQHISRIFILQEFEESERSRKDVRDRNYLSNLSLSSVSSSSLSSDSDTSGHYTPSRIYIIQELELEEAERNRKSKNKNRLKNSIKVTKKKLRRLLL